VLEEHVKEIFASEVCVEIREALEECAKISDDRV